jgi:hypothetical protein
MGPTNLAQDESHGAIDATRKPEAKDEPEPLSYWERFRPEDLEDIRHPNLVIEFVPRVWHKLKELPKFMQRDATARDWQAFLAIHTGDVSDHVRNGFHWTEENLQRKKGWIRVDMPHTIPVVKRREGWKHQRIWRLMDKDHAKGEPPAWIAELKVYTKDKRKILFDFDLEWLCSCNIERSFAFNWHDEMVFRFDHSIRERSFSLVNMPQPMFEVGDVAMKLMFGGKISREDLAFVHRDILQHRSNNPVHDIENDTADDTVYDTADDTIYDTADDAIDDTADGTETTEDEL